MKKSGKINKYNIILVVLIAFFLVVCSIVFGDIKKIFDTKKDYENIKEQCVSDKSGKENGRKINWDKLYKINDDIVAWIYIPGTPIDYPVVLTTDSNYYLSHDIHKKYSQYGSVFIDKTVNEKPFESKNLILFAHNMGRWTDVMFGSLMKYKEQAYYKKHKYVYLYTPSGKEKYKIISVREVSASSDAYNVDFKKGELKEWISSTAAQSVVPGIEIEDTEKIEKVMTLSTCTYGTSRLVLHCIPEEI